LGGVNVELFGRLFFVCQNSFWYHGCSLWIVISFWFFSLFVRLFEHLEKILKLIGLIIGLRVLNAALVLIWGVLLRLLIFESVNREISDHF